MDGHSWGFNECIRQIREFDPSFDISHLKEDLSEEEVDEERVNIFFFYACLDLIDLMHQNCLSVRA